MLAAWPAGSAEIEPRAAGTSQSSGRRSAALTTSFGWKRRKDCHPRPAPVTGALELAEVQLRTTGHMAWAAHQTQMAAQEAEACHRASRATKLTGPNEPVILSSPNMMRLRTGQGTNP